MGIRFRCPNGHRLHVKSFLAGKRGVCPDCDAKFVIPAESEQDVKPTRQRPKEPVAKTTAAQPQPRVVSPERKSPDRSPDRASDPLQDVPGAKWFVRPPAGGQYGPADAELLQTWIAEGRISSDCYLWRRGWDDWQLAAEVLGDLDRIQVPDEMAGAGPLPGFEPRSGPDEPVRVHGRGLAGPSASERASASGQGEVIPQVTVNPVDTLNPSASRYRQRKHTKLTRRIVVLLGLACAALLAALIYVVGFR